MKKPNILWICTDQQRLDTLGCYGNKYVKTPNLDALAASGFKFEKTFCQNPVSTPSRASFLTGRYPRTCRARQNGQNIPAEEMLVTKILADNGYYCGLAGKLHISACNGSVCKDMEPRIDDGYTDFHWSHHDGGGWGLHNEYWQWLEDQGHTYKTELHPKSKYVEHGMAEELSQTAWCVEKTIDFIDSRQNSSAPWLFSLNFFDPHHSFNPSREALSKFEDIIDDIPLPNFRKDELTGKPIWQNIDHNGAYGNHSGYSYAEMTDLDHRLIKASYWAMVETIDHQLGRLFKHLKALGEYDNTIIIFTSDHGEMLGDHGIYLKGPYFYDCAVNVPLLISWPEKIKSGITSSALVELVDLAPTLLDAMGIEIAPGMQGRSLYPMLCGNSSHDSHRKDVYCEFYGSNYKYNPHAFTTMVRTNEYKLTVAHKLGTGELYDFKNDPNEFNNLWDSEAYANKKSELLLLLCDRMAETVDPLPERIAMW